MPVLSQIQYIDKVIVDLLVVWRRQVPRIQTANKPPIFLVTKHAVLSQIQYIDKVIVDMRVVRQRQVPRTQTANKPSINQVTKLTVFPQIQYIDKVFVDMRVVMQRQVRHKAKKTFVASLPKNVQKGLPSATNTGTRTNRERGLEVSTLKP